MQFSLKILETDKQIATSILQALVPEVDNYLKKALQNIRSSLPETIRNILYSTPEYSSLIGGQLRYEFGIPNPSSSITNIINIWSNNVVVAYNAPTVSNSRIKASFSVSMIRSDYADVLSSDDALVIDSLRGYQLPWLEWLLLEGNKTIISKYQVQLGPSRSSRTGYAVMKPSNKSWKVPSEFSGTTTNNWITRAIDNAETQIEQLIEKAFA
jgi:hypothetical protein